MVEDKYIGLALAVSSSFLIGTSFIITKKGLNDAALRNAAYGAPSASDNLSYLQNPIWWGGMVTMVVGEGIVLTASKPPGGSPSHSSRQLRCLHICPPILVTPLGALSVLIGAVLASFLLNEHLGHLGRLGCTLCLIGSIIIVLHAPEDKPVDTIDEYLSYALRPGFLLYCFTVTVFTLVMIYGVIPKYGRSNPIYYISVCSLVGSVSVMAIKGFGISVKLTFSGNNQFTHPDTYILVLSVGFCILIQMNYFNKALDTFSTNVVNPMYYVGFSTCTIIASLIFFQGLNTTDGANTLSLLAGFVVTFLGVHLLNLSRAKEPPLHNGDGHSALEGGLMNPRLSLQGRVSLDGWNDTRVGPVPTPRHARRGSHYRNNSNTVFNAFDEHETENEDGEAVGLTDLREEDDEDVDDEHEAHERTRLHSGKELGQQQLNRSNSRQSGSRSQINSPNPSRPPSATGPRFS